MMVHGRDRSSRSAVQPAAALGNQTSCNKDCHFPCALAVGNFSGLANLAALGDDGAVHLLENSHAIVNLAARAGSHPTVSMSVRDAGGGRGGAIPSAPAPNGGRATRKQTLLRWPRSARPLSPH